MVIHRDQCFLFIPSSLVYIDICIVPLCVCVCVERERERERERESRPVSTEPEYTTDTEN